VTKHFSERGWRGLNVEPLTDEYNLLCADRPGDRCVRAAVAGHNGTVTLHVPRDQSVRSTIVDDVAADLPPDVGKRGTVEVRAVRLQDLLADEGVEAIDFLKIDVEGAE